MKKLLFVFGMLIIGLTSSLMNAQTNVSGIISGNTTWTVSSSPYIVTGNILVDSGFTLIIEPGVTVKFNSGLSMQIDGTLLAQGTNSNKINFTSNTADTAGAWGYIYFSDVSVGAVYDINGSYSYGSILEYCTVEFAGGASVSDNGAVRMNNAHPFINYCTIRNNKVTGIYAFGLTEMLKIKNSTIFNNISSGGGGGIYISGGTSIISYNNISSNIASGGLWTEGELAGENESRAGAGGGGLYVDFDNATITNNTINENNASTYGGGAIFYLGDNNNTGIIQSNTISNNSANTAGGAILLGNGYYDYNVNIKNNYILNNSASANGGGITTGRGRVTIFNNILENNNSKIEGGGIYITYNDNGVNTLNISNNNIINNSSVGNGAGIYRSATDGIVILANNIIGNNTTTTGNGGGIYGIYNYSGGTYGTLNVNLTNNTICKNSAIDMGAMALGYYSTDNLQYNNVTQNICTLNNSSKDIYILGNPNFNYNNIFNDTATYEIWNDNAQGTANINASNNWWGTSNDSEVQSKIYDWFDNGSLGIINYSPFLTNPDTSAPVSPPANVIKADIGSGQVKLTWRHNPESDIAGYHVYYKGFSGYSFMNMIDTGNNTTYTLSGISISDTIGVTAYNKNYSIANELDSTIVNDNMTNGNESWYAYAVDTAATTGVSVHDNEIPKIYTLQQNYPNPFNPSTNISFTLPYQSHVSLRVYDILGKEVATLVNEVKAAGSYTKQWNASQFASGIYFYGLTAGSFFETKKLVLLR